jgi:hypothetical protein
MKTLCENQGFQKNESAVSRRKSVAFGEHNPIKSKKTQMFFVQNNRKRIKKALKNGKSLLTKKHLCDNIKVQICPNIFVSGVAVFAISTLQR